MGRPYETELAQLPATYAWALEASAGALSRAVGAGVELPLLVAGSGGSLTVAHATAALHQSLTRQIAKAVTPLDLVATSGIGSDVAVMLVSAGGGNPDVLGAFARVVEREPRQLTVVCGRLNSKLANLARDYCYVDLVELALPVEKDGFLATNSLLAFTTLLSRSYVDVCAPGASLPETLEALVHPGISTAEYATRLDQACDRLWSRDTTVVLFGPSLFPVAVDIESKFTEAALGSVQLADYRNFAHGRHHWFAKRAASSSVLALVTEVDRRIADRTLRLLPTGVPCARVEVPHAGHAATLAGLVVAQRIAGLAGRARGIDPGRPGVPAFGSRIYRLTAYSRPRRGEASLMEMMRATAIQRKTAAAGRLRADGAQHHFWEAAFNAFVRRLQEAMFHAVLFDYDGTLCDRRDRFTGLRADIEASLRRLLDSGILLGVATGRGRSVREILRQALPKSSWGQVIVGYYNGGDCAGLDDDSRPDNSEHTCDALAPVAAALAADARLATCSKLTPRRTQVTAEPVDGASCTAVWEIVHDLVRASGVEDVLVVRSSHSVDVLAPGVSKLAVVEQLRARLSLHPWSDPAGSRHAVLCIGDRGRWPGNDAALLREPYSLSVDEVSVDPYTCWNVAPPGHRGVQATQAYLGMLLTDSAHSAVRFRAPSRSPKREAP